MPVFPPARVERRHGTKMESKGLSLDGNILWTGVRLAKARSEDPILCLIRKDAVKFVALSGQRLVISWEYKVTLPTKSNIGLLIPPVVAQLMSTEAIKKPVNIQLEDHQATLTIADQSGPCEVRWHSDLAGFPTPPEFKQFIALPPNLIEVSYLTVSDAAHKAVANLVTMESADPARRDKLAILVDFGAQKLIMDGREITSGEAARYYFDPRLIIRALEFVKSERVGVAVTGMPARNQAILSVVANQGNCQVHCALISIGMDTQKLYPLPPGRSR
jgi:hypothetical protein